MTALQEQTERDYQARISGLMESLASAMPGAGFLLGGVIVAVFSPRAAFAAAGAGLLLIVLAALPLRSRLEGRRRGAGNGLDVAGPRLPDTFGTRPTVEAGAGRDGS
jgi:hypothetical protein